MALQRPEAVTAIISQNGNAYEEGLSPFWNPVKDVWKNNTEETRKGVAAFTSFEGIKWQVRFLCFPYYATYSHVCV